MSVAFSPNGKQVVSGSRDKSLKLWNVETGKELSTMRGHSEDNPECICFEEEEEASDEEDAEEKPFPRPDCPVTGHSRLVTAVSWNNDGTKLVSGSFDETVKIWSVGSAGTFEYQSTASTHM